MEARPGRGPLKQGQDLDWRRTCPSWAQKPESCPLELLLPLSSPEACPEIFVCVCVRHHLFDPCVPKKPSWVPFLKVPIPISPSLSEEIFTKAGAVQALLMQWKS